MERAIRVRPTDRKYQFITFSSARINDVDFYRAFAERLAEPGVRRAIYDHFANIDFKGFNFIKDRVMLQEYVDAKLLAVRRELTFLRDYYIDFPSKMTVPFTTSQLFTDFMTWTKEKASMGGSAEYSSTSVGFGMFVSKIPGFVKNTRNSKLRSYNPLDVPKFVDYMKSIELYSEDEAEWMILYAGNKATRKLHTVCDLQQWIEATEQSEAGDSTTLDGYRRGFCDYDDCKCGQWKLKTVAMCEWCLHGNH
jgi:hypothetical protein